MVRVFYNFAQFVKNNRMNLRSKPVCQIQLQGTCRPVKFNFKAHVARESETERDLIIKNRERQWDD